MRRRKCQGVFLVFSPIVLPVARDEWRPSLESEEMTGGRKKKKESFAVKGVKHWHLEVFSK